MNRAFSALGRAVVRFRWLIIIIWIVGTVFAAKTLPSLGSEVNNNSSQFLPVSAPSVQAANLAKPLIGSSSASQVPVVVVTKAPNLHNAPDQTGLSRLEQDLSRVPTVTTVKLLGLSKSQNAAQILVLSSVQPLNQVAAKQLMDNLESAITKAKLPTDMSANLSGAEASNVANQKQSSQQGNEIQLLSILFIFLLLCIIFRSVVAPILTLFSPILVLTLSGYLIGALGAHGLKISDITQILLIVLLLGAGTDYGLFLVFRVREEIYAGRDPKEAVAHSVLRVGESISASAGTVIVALLSLLLASFGIYHDLGIPLAIGVFMMLLAGLTLLPAVLAVLGKVAFWPTKPKPRDHKHGLWGQIAGKLVQRPAVTLATGVLVFGALSVVALGFKPGGFGGQISAPPGSNAAKGNAALVANFPQASENPTNVIMRFSTPIWQHPATLLEATSKLVASGAFTKVSSPLDSTGVLLTPTQLRTLHEELGPARQLKVPEPSGLGVPINEYYAYLATALYISPDGSTAQWEVGLRAGDPSSTSALDAIPSIRKTVSAIGHEVGASASGVAGQASALYDVSTISDNDLHRIVPVAILAIGILLAIVLRSLVAPLYLIVSVLLSYLASLGVAVIVFMKVSGAAGITFLLPFLMFIFLLALGEDYNILVMTRIREEASRLPLKDAVIRAVGVTGTTVTSAGVVLAGTFAVLAIVGGQGSGNSEIRAIGLGLTVGILLDTFVVRTVLVPSAVALLGRWNWWPSKLAREHAATKVVETQDVLT